MMQHEFEERLGGTVDSEVYHIVEIIYMDARWVSDVGGKDQVAQWMKDSKNAEAVRAVSVAWEREMQECDEKIKEATAEMAAKTAEVEAAKKKVEAAEKKAAEASQEAKTREAEVRAVRDWAGDLEAQIEAQESQIRDLRRRVLLYRMKEGGFTEEEIDLIQEG